MTTQEQQTDKVLAYIGIGCNLGECAASIASAIDTLSLHPRCADVRAASLYESDPMGPPDQPKYLNTVVSLETSLTAQELLALTQSIESDHGRVRTGERWGPRTLDLDILLFGNEVMNTDTLTIPHPGIAMRSFVLLPLAELQPNLTITNLGPIDQLLKSCEQFGIRKLQS